jgi:hypothetical protein
MKKTMGDNMDPTMKRMVDAMILDIPLHSMKMASNGTLTDKKVEGIAELANGKFIKGIGKLISK